MKKFLVSTILSTAIVGCTPLVPTTQPTTQPISVLQNDFNIAQQVLLDAEIAVSDAQAAANLAPPGPAKDNLLKILATAQQYEAIAQVAFNIAAAALGVTPTPPAVASASMPARLAQMEADKSEADLNSAITNISNPDQKAMMVKALGVVQQYKTAVKAVK